MEDWQRQIQLLLEVGDQNSEVVDSGIVIIKNNLKKWKITAFSVKKKKEKKEAEALWELQQARFYILRKQSSEFIKQHATSKTEAANAHRQYNWSNCNRLLCPSC